MRVESVTIGTANDIAAVRRRLDFEFRFLQQEGLDIRVSESEKGHLKFLDLSLEHSPATWRNDAGLFRYYIANALSDVILGDCEQRLIHKMVRDSYSYFTEDERQAIYYLTLEHLNSRPGASGIDPFPRIARKGRVLARLTEYLENSNDVVLEGFITFRLREYLDELDRAVDRAVDDYLLEREYREFIRLLKYFVDAQEPKIDEVHVVMSGKDSFKLVDSQLNTINDAHLEQFVAEMVENDINHDDLLISALITIAPRHIVLHCAPGTKGRESIQTITSVFAGRVAFCDGCRICNQDAGGTSEGNA
ncbi:MAG: putative sporulation protein YtxC [Chloroflexota bacterium]